MTITNNKFKTYVDRIERINSDITDLQSDRKEVFAQAKGDGFDLRTLRDVLRLRKLSEQQRKERQELLEIYLGALEGTPLGNATREANNASND